MATLILCTRWKWERGSRVNYYYYYYYIVTLYEHVPLSDEDEEAWLITMERIDPNGYISRYDVINELSIVIYAPQLFN